ncbi:MAG: hypothetical protein RR312_02460 [Bacteroidales bacterium]
MNKCYVITIIGLICMLPLQPSFAKENISANKILYDKAETSLNNGDTLGACAIYRTIKIKIDSIAQINYQNEVKAKRTTYQIDELYLENKLQEGIILRRLSLFLLIIAILLIPAFYYLRTHNQKLEQARIKAKRLKEEAELLTKKKSILLYTISKDMTESLIEIKESTANLQTIDAESLQQAPKLLSNLRSSEEKLQSTYNKIFS